jgi:hypothetical protein
MTSKEIAAIIQAVMPKDQPYAIKGRMALLIPVGHLLQAITFDKTSDKSRCDIVYFTMPLFQRADRVFLDYGNFLRENGRQDWLLTGPGVEEKLGERLRSEALPFLLDNGSLARFAELVATLPRLGIFGRERGGLAETLAYTFTRMGRYAEAVEHFGRMDAFIEVERPDWATNPRLEWVRQMKKNAQLLVDLIHTDPARAQKQLDEWEAQTARNLGIEKFRTDGIEGLGSAVS